MSALGIPDDAQGGLFSGSPHAGMEALCGAWDAVASGHAERALVVVSDALVPGLGTAWETTCGSGAAAFVLGPAEGAPAVLHTRATRSAPALDRYRADGTNATGDPYDPRLFHEEVYLPVLAAAANAANAAATGRGEQAVSAWSLADPDGKLAAVLAKRLGTPEPLSTPAQSELGDTGRRGRAHRCCVVSRRSRVGRSNGLWRREGDCGRIQGGPPGAWSGCDGK